MPELPEVESVRARLEKALKGRRICEVYAEETDRFLFAETPLAEFQKALTGAKVRGSGRKGKYFWLELDRKPWPVFHLGMTGNVEIKPAKKSRSHGWGGVKLWSSGEKESSRSWFCRMLLTAENGTEVALTDPRRFGRVWLADAPLLHPRIKKLGSDPLLDPLPAKELLLILKKRKAPIKAVLLDQKLFAGVGNWIADEILFQSGISPRRPAASLSLSEVTKLRAKIHSIIRKAVAVEADYERFPKSWLFHHRWGRDSEAKTYGRQKIIHEEIGGRTTAWVPSAQK
jgi:formamidopyrimidine-DNA glycosylase